MKDARILCAAYLLLIALGLTYVSVLGALHR